MKLISLYSGVGGLDSGFLDAGIELALANDFDKDACATYCLNNEKWKDRVICDDIKDVLSRIGRIDCDLLLAGFPCPAWSVAGKRNGFEDERGREFFMVLAALANHRPKYFYLENVKGLLSHDNGKSFAFMTEALRNLGYAVDYRLYSTDDFGVPQKRKRLIIAGSAFGKDGGLIRNPISMLPEPEIIDKQSLILKDVLERVKDAHGEPCRDHPGNHNLHNPETKMHWIKIVKEGENLKNLEEKEIRNRESKAGLDHRRIPKSAMDYKRLDSHVIAPTMIFGNTSLPIHPIEDRNISVREAAAIQSFPMDFIFLGGIASQYKQVGNAVPPLLGKALAKQFMLEKYEVP